MTHKPKSLIVLTLLCVLCVFTVASHSEPVKRLSKPVESDATGDTYGARFIVKGETLRLKEVIKEDECEKDKPVTIKTEVSEVCQKKGCFMIASDEELVTRVTFKDYSFFVPTNISGRKVVMNAVLTPVEPSEKDAKHITADLASNTSIAKGPTCELTAHSVKVLN